MVKLRERLGSWRPNQKLTSKGMNVKRKLNRLKLSHRLTLLMLLPTLGVGCALLQKNNTLAKQGDFPPCIGITDAEVLSIRQMMNVNNIKDEAEQKLVREREQNVLNVLGRMALWCSAYHERIGYKPEKKATAVPPAPLPAPAPEPAK